MTTPAQSDEFDPEEVIADMAMRIGNLEANLGIQRSANRKLRAQLDELRTQVQKQSSVELPEVPKDIEIE